MSSVVSTGGRSEHRLFRRTTKVSHFHRGEGSTRHELSRTRRGLIHLLSVLNRLRDHINPLGTRDRGTTGFVRLSSRGGGLRVNI